MPRSAFRVHAALAATTVLLLAWSPAAQAEDFSWYGESHAFAQRYWEREVAPIVHIGEPVRTTLRALVGEGYSCGLRILSIPGAGFNETSATFVCQRLLPAEARLCGKVHVHLTVAWPTPSFERARLIDQIDVAATTSSFAACAGGSFVPVQADATMEPPVRAAFPALPASGAVLGDVMVAGLRAGWACSVTGHSVLRCEPFENVWPESLKACRIAEVRIRATPPADAASSVRAGNWYDAAVEDLEASCLKRTR